MHSRKAGAAEKVAWCWSSAGSTLRASYGIFLLGSISADKNESELVQEGFCHLTCISPLEVRIYEYQVAYALHYFFEKQGQPLANKIIDLVGVTHKIDPSAAEFVFECFIAPKVVVAQDFPQPCRPSIFQLMSSLSSDLEP
jgi:hypothetical protein